MLFFDIFCIIYKDDKLYIRIIFLFFIMIPVSFGKKKALLINPRCNNQGLKKKHQTIINKLNQYISVNVWKKNNNKMNHKNMMQLKNNPYLVHPILEKRNKNNRTENLKQYFLYLSNINNKDMFFIEKKNHYICLVYIKLE